MGAALLDFSATVGREVVFFRILLGAGHTAGAYLACLRQYCPLRAASEPQTLQDLIDMMAYL